MHNNYKNPQLAIPAIFPSSLYPRREQGEEMVAIPGRDNYSVWRPGATPSLQVFGEPTESKRHQGQILCPN